MLARSVQSRPAPATRPELITIACTGLIGAGKSTVAALLAQRGAVIVDADALARDVLEPGSPGYQAVLDRFGPSILAEATSSGSGPPPIDRARLAGLVFGDPSALFDLEAIVHPKVRQRIDAILRTHEGSDDVVVLELPLLVRRGSEAAYRLDGVLLVDVPEEVALERLVRQRQMDPDDARSRMSAQPSRLERLRAADFVIMNIGTRDELEEMVAQAWSWIIGLASKTASRGVAAGPS
jgi:dephospho-CoA kinase